MGTKCVAYGCQDEAQNQTRFCGDCGAREDRIEAEWLPVRKSHGCAIDADCEAAARIAERFGWLHAAESIRVGIVMDGFVMDVEDTMDFWIDFSGLDSRETRQLRDLSRLCSDIRSA